MCHVLHASLLCTQHMIHSIQPAIAGVEQSSAQTRRQLWAASSCSHCLYSLQGQQQRQSKGRNITASRFGTWHATGMRHMEQADIRALHHTSTHSLRYQVSQRQPCAPSVDPSASASMPQVASLLTCRASQPTRRQHILCCALGGGRIGGRWRGLSRVAVQPLLKRCKFMIANEVCRRLVSFPFPFRAVGPRIPGLHAN